MSRFPSLASEPAGQQAQVLILDGEFDVSSAARFERAIDDALDSGRPHLIVDLRGVSFLDSRMLLALIRALKQARARDAELALLHPNPHVWRLFVLTGLSEGFLVFRQLADAVAALESRSSSDHPEPVLRESFRLPRAPGARSARG